LLTAEPKFVIPRQLDTISSATIYSLIPTVIQQIEEFERPLGKFGNFPGQTSFVDLCRVFIKIQANLYWPMSKKECLHGKSPPSGDNFNMP